MASGLKLIKGSRSYKNGLFKDTQAWTSNAGKSEREKLRKIIDYLNTKEAIVLKELGEFNGKCPLNTLIERCKHKWSLGEHEINSIVERLSKKGLIKKLTFKRRILVAKKKLDELPEKKLLQLVEEAGGIIGIEELVELCRKKGIDIEPALGWARKKGLVKVYRSSGAVKVKQLVTCNNFTRESNSIISLIREACKMGAVIDELDEELMKTLSELRERGFIDIRQIKNAILLMTDFGKKALREMNVEEVKEKIGALTEEMLSSSKWMNLSIKAYNLNSGAKCEWPAHEHIFSAFIEKIKSILISCGFCEVKSNIIESVLWNYVLLLYPIDLFIQKFLDEALIINYCNQTGKTLELREEIMQLFNYLSTYTQRGVGIKTTALMLKTEPMSTILKHLVVGEKWRKILLSRGEIRVFCLQEVIRKKSIRQGLEEYFLAALMGGEDVALMDAIKIMELILTELDFKKYKVVPAYIPYAKPGIRVIAWGDKGKVEELYGGVLKPDIVRILQVKCPIVFLQINLSEIFSIVTGYTSHYIKLDKIREDSLWLKFQ